MYSYSPDKSCKVNLNFRDGINVITRNYYAKTITVTQGVLNFYQNVLIVDNELLTIPKEQSKYFTIRVRMKVSALPFSGVSSVCATIANESLFSYSTVGAISSVGTNVKYINGVVGTNVIVGQTAEYVITTSNTTLKTITQLFGNNAGSYVNADIELIEIYNRVLSPAEINNLYEGKTFVPFEDSSEVFHLNAYRGVINDRYNKIASITNATVRKNDIILNNGNISANINLSTANSYSFWINYAPKLITNYVIGGSSKIDIYFTTSYVLIFSRNAGIASPTSNTEHIKKYTHYIICDNNGLITYYKNGVLIHTKTITGSLTGNEAIIIGGATSKNLLKNVRIFNRALISQEASQIYTSERKMLNL